MGRFIDLPFFNYVFFIRAGINLQPDSQANQTHFCQVRIFE